MSARDLSFIDGYKAARRRLMAGPQPKRPSVEEVLAGYRLSAQFPMVDVAKASTHPIEPSPVELPMVRALQTVEPSEDCCISILEIAREVCKKYSVSLSDLKSARRNHDLVVARHEAMWRAKNETLLSFPQIGRYFGDRDHTTAIYGVKMHEMRAFGVPYPEPMRKIARVIRPSRVPASEVVSP